MDPYEDAGTRKMYNLTSCMNILTSNTIGVSIKQNIVGDLKHFVSTFDYSLGTRSTVWKQLANTIIDYIDANMPTFDDVLFPKTMWNGTDGFMSKMTPSDTSLDRLVSFIFRYYVPYDVYKLLPIDCSFVPQFTIPNKNPIQYLVLMFIENLTRYIINKNDIISIESKLPYDVMTLLVAKINHIGNAYLGDGIQSYDTVIEHRTNMLASIIPEMFQPDDTLFKSHHYPFDVITSMTCYLLDNMTEKFNAYYGIVTNQEIYDAMGNPFMNINDQFVSSDNFYVYGNQMYNNSYELISRTIDGYQNDLDRYDKYGKTLRIKNIYLDKQKYTYCYPIETYIEFHKAFYNNPNMYINTIVSNYADTYTNILSVLNTKLLPMLKYLNIAEHILMSPMDTLISSNANRLVDAYVNPYNATNDPERFEWYDEKIIGDILNNEEEFDPSVVGLIEYYLAVLMSDVNPFGEGTYLYDWYNDIDRRYLSSEITKMNYLFGLPYLSANVYNSNAITPVTLYGDIGNINNKYSGFANITDFIKYLMDHTIHMSQLGQIVTLFKATIPATIDALLEYYSTEKSASIDVIDKINPYTLTSVNGSVKYSKLEDIVRNIYNKKPVNFAWIKEIGHYIIDNIQLIFGDAVIDQMTGEFLHIIEYTEGTMSKKIGYEKMIGNVSELTTFNSEKKHRYVLYIPIMFTFSKFYESALPLVCMAFTDVFIRVKLREFSDVAYWAPMTKFNKTPKLKCSINADYIYVEPEERMRVAQLRQEQIMEQIQYNGDFLVNLGESNIATVRLNFTGLSKELFILCQMSEYTDGSLPNGEKQWHNYLVNVPSYETVDNGVTTVHYNDVNPIDTIQIKYNGRERETTKDVMYYACLQRFKYHNVGSFDGINVYSFSIAPQLLQPSGSANLGKIGDVDIVIKFRDDVVAMIGKNKKTMRIGVYNKAVNILRIMSGLAGLAFYD